MPDLAQLTAALALDGAGIWKADACVPIEDPS
jgi:hypothetical protein